MCVVATQLDTLSSHCSDDASPHILNVCNKQILGMPIVSIHVLKTSLYWIRLAPYITQPKMQECYCCTFLTVDVFEIRLHTLYMAKRNRINQEWVLSVHLPRNVYNHDIFTNIVISRESPGEMKYS